MYLKMGSLFLLFLGAVGPNSGHAITMEVRRISDNSPSGVVDFGAIATANRGLANQYVVVRYEVGEEDTNTLKVFSDNEEWANVLLERGGLVETGSHAERVPVFWKAFDSVQSNLVFDAQSVLTWAPLKDVNDPGFANYNPSDLSIPLYPSGTTVLYFGADVALTNSAASYAANIKVKNGAVQGNALVYSQGFGAFNGVFRPSLNNSFDIPVGVKNSANVSLKVINRQGKEVRTITNADYAPGNHQFSWDGNDSDGNKLASGVYMFVLQIGSDKFKRKVAIIK